MLKKPQADGLVVEKLRIANDVFDSPKYHCREHSVVYAYSWPSLIEFGTLLGRSDLAQGAVGENLSLSSLDESKIYVGDQFQVDEVILEATSARIPCSKLNFCFQHKEAQKLFIKHGKPGIYFRVLKSGKIRPQTEMQLIHQQMESPSIQDFYDIMTKRKSIEAELVKKFLRQKAFPDEFRESFQDLLGKALNHN